VHVEEPRPRIDPARPASAARPRTLVAFSPETVARYTRLVAAVGAEVEAGLSSAVSANRLVACALEPPALRFASWRAERANFTARMAGLARTHSCLVFADVRDCYGSIAPSIVETALADLGIPAPAAGAVRAFLDEVNLGGIRGLPIGPDPSPVLANAVLARADGALERAGIPHLRWVDDVVAGAADRRCAGRVLGVLAEALQTIGLELNESKTRVVLDPSTAVLSVPVSVAGAGVPVG
jgi:hypothetical protein